MDDYLENVLPKLNEENLKKVLFPFFEELKPAFNEKQKIGTYLYLNRISGETKKKIIERIKEIFK